MSSLLVEGQHQTPSLRQRSWHCRLTLGQPLMDGIEGGTSSETVDPSLETETQDEETLTTSEIVEDGDPGPSTRRPSSSPGDKQGEDIKKVYKISTPRD
ncbi:hypothetical protein AAFF_G00308700 [Aldrovandia affinis]|uniref:Uncharacterized protein n=1 Tax=Aldrovandia affinis TaxID=143900 RepID=A0AAD7SPX9_9TELE|nr:hypothetical protein AAFF_G00308700 [Aldrovandia affinis]